VGPVEAVVEPAAERNQQNQNQQEAQGLLSDRVLGVSGVALTQLALQ
jgi:hypothetical protein